MIKRTLPLLLGFLLGCENIDDLNIGSKNLLVFDGWITNESAIQTITISLSNNFLSDQPNPPIKNAKVVVVDTEGNKYPYHHSHDGVYASVNLVEGKEGSTYRLEASLPNFGIFYSQWEKMPHKTEINSLFPQRIRTDEDIFYPKVIAYDTEGENFYRWLFYKDGVRLYLPEAITIQNDRLFDGGFISNTFDSFEYETAQKMEVVLLSISKNTFDYLFQIKSQSSSLGTSTGTTPSKVDGNIFAIGSTAQQTLGYFGAVAMSRKEIIIE